MATASRREHRDVKVLYNIPFNVYARMVEDEANHHLRMSYHDGTLEIVSPKHLRHEIPSARFFLLVATVAEVLGVNFKAVGSGTFKRAGHRPLLGVGKEPDQAFYFANLGRLPKDREVDLNAGDPPPDLWIEVDNRVSSAGRLPVYAALRVPEVWQYRVKTGEVRFWRLAADHYESAGRSLSLPVLSPVRVQDALRLGESLDDLQWIRAIREWIPTILDGPANPA